jgi:hypothetical protein
MATLVKLRGLDRATTATPNSAASGGEMFRSGFRVKSGVLSPSVTGGTSVKASRVTGTGATNQITWTARTGGVTGNNISITVAAASGTAGTATFAVSHVASTGLPSITATPGTGTTAAQLASLANKDPEVSQYVTAAPTDGTGAGTSLTQTILALQSGANGTGTSEPFYLTANSKSTVVVDLDDAATQRMLYRNKARYVSLGQP